MRRVLGAIGRVLITIGLLMLLFVAYQLWGTGIYEARAQNRLGDEFHRQLTHRATTNTAPTAATGSDDPTVPVTSTLPPTTTTVLPPPPDLHNGDSVGQIDIPKIGVSKFIVEGVDVSDLRQGPGHYPGTPLPGQEGNAAIAGHRTTYGAPFGNIDQLATGDDITIQTVQGTFTYRVDRDPFAVDPGDGDVLKPEPDPARPGHNLAQLTLTTCTPKYSAAQRLIVKARLVFPQGTPLELPLPPSPGTANPKPHTISGLSGERSSRAPALLWGLIAALVGGLWWLLFHRHPRWATWFVGVLPFLVVLFVFYTYLERMLPSNY